MKVTIVICATVLAIVALKMQPDYIVLILLVWGFAMIAACVENSN